MFASKWSLRKTLIRSFNEDEVVNFIERALSKNSAGEIERLLNKE